MPKTALSARQKKIEAAVHRVIARCIIHIDHAAAILVSKRAADSVRSVIPNSTHCDGFFTGSKSHWKFEFPGGSSLLVLLEDAALVNVTAGMRFNTVLGIGISESVFGKQLLGRCTRAWNGESPGDRNEHARL